MHELTRRFAGFLVAGLLVACGGNGNDGGADQESSDATTVVTSSTDDSGPNGDDVVGGAEDDSVTTDTVSDSTGNGESADGETATEPTREREPGIVADTPRTGPTVEVAEPQLPATVVDATGETIEVASIDRIVSLQADLTEFLLSLGLADRVVGVDNQSSIVPGMEDKEVVGSSFELSAEGVLALEPTLVLIKDNAGPQAAIDAIEAAGIPVVVVRTDVTLEVASENAIAVAAAVGAADAGEELASLIEADIQAGRELAATLPSSPTVAYVNIGRGGGPGLLGLTGPVHPLIDAAGGTDVAAELGIDEPMAPLAAEALLDVEPDVLLTGAINLETAGGLDEFVALPGIAGTRAVANNEVFAYDMSLVLSRGPRTGMAVLELAELFTEVAARS